MNCASSDSTVPTKSPAVPDPVGGWYDQFLVRLRARFATFAGRPLFATDAAHLCGAYLAALPDEQRQHYTCTTCARFVSRFGRLVVVEPDGSTVPVFWPDDEEGWHGDALRGVHKIVKRAKIAGVHVSAEPQWGTPETGPWRHMSVTPELARVYGEGPGRKRAWERAAELREDHHMLCRALATHDADRARAALRMLREGTLPRAERFDGMAAWFLGLHEIEAKGARRDNLIWLAVATAPAGWAHVGNTVLGTLMEDIGAGKPEVLIRARYAEKMGGLQYQRPTAAPTEGQVARAEQIVADMGLAASLPRRFARLDEVPMIWTPRKTDAEQPAGVFGHLIGKPPTVAGSEAPAVSAPPMTWTRFAATVLSEARGIEFWSGGGFPPLRMIFLTTAVNSDAPPILQWDRPEKRNPVAWFCWYGGMQPAEVGLAPYTWHPVVGVTNLPCTWGEQPHNHAGEGTILLLREARDRKTVAEACGGSFFPEFLRGELREVRAVLEAHARTLAVQDGDRDDLACGIDLRKGQSWNVFVRVHGPLGLSVYRLDRWE